MPAVGIHHTATTNDAWDAGENEKRLSDDANLNKMYAWKPESEDDQESKSKWKFPHHMVGSDGKPGAANLKACSSGIGNLNGGRGGTTIPSGDRAGVHAHLSAHLKDAGKDVPDLKSMAAIKADAKDGDGPDDADQMKTKYRPGDRVKVRPGQEHEEDHEGVEGRVTQASSQALAIKFDGSDEPHKWYTDAEITPADSEDPKDDGNKQARRPTVPSGNRLPHVIRALCEVPWAIMPTKLQAIIEVLQLRAAGMKADADLLAFFDHDGDEREIRAALKPAGQGGAVAVLPLYGTISQRMSIMSQMSGSTSTDKFGQMFDQAMADPSIKALVFDCDSPGGTISGVEELASKIFKARGKKPMVAQVNSLMASAAYWICSACDEIAITPTGAAGSIGVFAAHTDFSAADAAAGVKTTLISAGKFKTEGNEYEPLDDGAREAMQDMVNTYYSMFTKSVARNRGASVDDVRNGYGQGRVLTAQEAVNAGLCDRVATLDQTLARLGASANSVKAPMSEEMMRRRMRAARYGLLIEGEEAR